MNSEMNFILAPSPVLPVTEAGPLGGAREIVLVDGQGERLRIGRIRFERDGCELPFGSVDFSDHVPSMRSFRCNTRGARQLCHLEDPLAPRRRTSARS